MTKSCVNTISLNQIRPSPSGALESRRCLVPRIRWSQEQPSEALEALKRTAEELVDIT